ncbi:hypothetical protein DUNSADRAFT_3539 [Dunaliella salina]|uniref:Uncharacterized protein n=1 Tax=Dunaliella salina TaxID=3046 RepID=A0ABQ7H7W2_DUNSA|nr:hypothetical protein DUNSADRAFT_3539 [Dunaliella salina]|eukprot:KAF5842946.1 hypothetical protein DUNSADRAFT_3539 [Dunaliella salina]
MPQTAETPSKLSEVFGLNVALLEIFLTVRMTSFCGLQLYGLLSCICCIQVVVWALNHLWPCNGQLSVIGANLILS